jgi:hypothetical protein
MLVARRLLAALCAVFLTSTTLPAAPLRPPANENPAVLISIDKGGKDQLTSEENNRFTDFRDGKQPIVDGGKTERNREILAKAARWYAWRITLPNVYETSGENSKLVEAMKQAYQQLLLNSNGERMKTPAEQTPYLKEYGKEFTTCLREALSKNGTMIVRVNTARLLAAVAVAGYEEVADTLLDLITDPEENGAVKVWAFRGLKELFLQGTPAQSILAPKREQEAIVALIDFINTPAKVAAGTPPEEVDAYRFVRREAVRALAQSRYPLVPKVQPGQGQTALTLLRVMRKDGLVPEPSVSEQTEAALGLLRLQGQPGYQPDYAAYQIGLFLVDFLSQYNQARAAGGVGFPFHVAAAKLSDNLEELKTQVKLAAPTDKEAASFIDKLVEEGKKSLKPVAVDPKTTRDLKNAEPEALDTWLRKLKSPPALYKGMTEAVLKSAG